MTLARSLALLCLLSLVASAPCVAAPASTQTVWLESLDLRQMTAGWGRPQVAKSCMGLPMTLSGKVYSHGVGTHAPSEAIVALGGRAKRFEATVGLDDERKGLGSITFAVYVDGREAASTPVVHGGDPPRRLSVDLRGARYMVLEVTEAGDNNSHDHADWADARILLASTGGPGIRMTSVPVEPPPVIHSGTSPVPAIHGPRIVGGTPGRPFLFRIPATGAAPLTFAAQGLPPGLKLDPRTGIISGAITRAGEYRVKLAVRGPRGVGRRQLRIVGGPNKLALTPPMGWNSWYVWYLDVTQERMKQAAEWLVRSGLAAHGYQYVNIDDGWEGQRSPEGEILTNAKFPDMKRLGDDIHRLGLKFGIYTSPGPKTCGGYEGSYGHEYQDIRTYERWGVDFVKHDWCSYGSIARGNTLTEYQKPYRLMQRAIAAVDRDMVYSLCQYGMGDVWKWGPSVGANLWRTTGDSGDTWGSVSGIGFAQAGLERYVGPGHWNDPDMIMAGNLGGGATHPTRLTPHEQVTQMTLWSLIAAPLLLSCDLSRLDRFTRDLLTNDEVLDVNQDPLGKAASRLVRVGQTEVWARPLFDGTRAVGLFNRAPIRRSVTVKWSALGLVGRQPVRDLWRQRGLGRFQGSFTASVPPHGAVLVKVGTPKPNGW